MSNCHSNRTVNILRERAELAAQNNVITLNIGLVASDDFLKEERDRVLPPEPSTTDLLRLPSIVTDILLDLKELGFDVLRYRVAQSQSEPTLVVNVVHESRYVVKELSALCNRYAQDCLALSDTDGHGALVGDKSSKWGDFAREFFIAM